MLNQPIIFRRVDGRIADEWMRRGKKRRMVGWMELEWMVKAEHDTDLHVVSGDIHIHFLFRTENQVI